jgi:hypothetical protein
MSSQETDKTDTGVGINRFLDQKNWFYCRKKQVWGRKKPGLGVVKS